MVDDPGACARSEVKVGHVDQALEVTRSPRRPLQARQRSNVRNHPRALSGKGDPAIFIRFCEIQFAIRLAEGRANRGQLVEQAAFELSRLDLVLLARKFIDHRYTNLRIANTIAQLRGQIPLDLLAAQSADALEQGPDLEFGAPLGKEHPSKLYDVARIPFTHNHLIDSLIGTGRSDRERVAHGPEAQKTDTKSPCTPSPAPSAFKRRLTESQI